MVRYFQLTMSRKVFRIEGTKVRRMLRHCLKINLLNYNICHIISYTWKWQ